MDLDTYTTALATLTAAYKTLTTAQLTAHHGDQDTFGAAMKNLREAAFAMRVQACDDCDDLAFVDTGPGSRLCTHPAVPGPYLRGETITDLIAAGACEIGLTPDADGVMRLPLDDGVTAFITPHPVVDVLWWRVEVHRGDVRGGRGICAARDARGLARTLADALPAT